MGDLPEVRKLVQAMHDTLCQCGGWCFGAEDDLSALTEWVQDRWGSVTPLEGVPMGARWHLTTC